VQAHAAVGRRLQVGSTVHDGSNHPVALHPGLDIVGGGPWLVRGGRPDVDVRADGIMHPGDPSFMYGWGVRRNPRTMVGVDGHHRLLLATVDGRQPGFSAGMTLGEEARFMRSLGAVDAMNLDGGGSTTMAIRGRLVNSPSDSTGERPVGDVLEVSAPRP
jgi:exopolysaccharide biosynthesis protein